jgi:hypothetical protein
MKLKIAAPFALIAAECLSSAAFAERQNDAPIDTLYGPEPIAYTMRSDFNVIGTVLTAPLSLFVTRSRNSGMSDRLTGMMYRRDQKYSQKLHAEFRAELSALGVALGDQRRARVDPTKPETIQSSTINPDGKTVIYTYFESIGVRSHHNKSYYQPSVYAVYCIVTPAVKNDCTASDRIVFGDNYEDSETTIAATPDQRWADSDDVYLRVEDLDKTIQEVIPKMAAMMAQSAVEAIRQLP